MEQEPIVVIQTVNASPERVWEALTDREQMKNWYFDIEDFKAAHGESFQFYGGTPERQYLHLCEITEVKPGKVLSYSWRYEDDPGISYVSFELFPEAGGTRVRLTHSGIESFSQANPDFKRQNFVDGWTHILTNSLKDYVEQK